MTFIRYFFIFMLLWLGLYFAIVWGQIGNSTKGSQWVAEVYAKKTEYAQSITKPKIVIVSGSNGLFGIDSAMLAKAFAMPVVNMCVNAGIDLPPILEHGKRVIREGDIVFLPLEYPLYSYDGEPIVQMIDYLYAREPDMLDILSYQEQFWMAWHVSIERLYRGYSDAKDTTIKGVYGVHNIDHRGDQNNTKGSLEFVSKPESYGSTYKKEALAWEYLSRFVEWCRAKEVKVIFMPSTLMESDFYHSNPKEREYYNTLATRVREQGYNYIGKPYDYMYPKELYFNTNFHLNAKGRQIRTKQMIEELLGIW